MPEETTASNKATELLEAETLIGKEQWEAAFNSIKTYWLKHPTDRDAIALMSQMMTKLNRPETASQLLKLSSTEKAIETDVQNLFQTGFDLINERQHELAVMLLEICHKLATDQAIVSYELGFALMSLKRYEEAIKYLEKARSKEEDFNTLLNLAVCNSHLRNVQKSLSYLEKASKLSLSEDEKTELSNQHTIIERLTAFAKKPALDCRDWIYINYGSILLMQSNITSGNFGALWNDYENIALTLLVLSKVIKSLGLSYNVAEYYSTLSRPLADALANMLSINADGYKGPEQQGQALLMMAWASDIIGPHESFINQDGKRNIFAYGVTSLEALPVTPEIIGYITESCAMPWSEHWKVEEYTDGRPPNVIHTPADDSDPSAIAEKILDAAHKLENNPSIAELVSEITNYYQDKKEYLVINNPDKFPHRAEYHAEVSQ